MNYKDEINLIKKEYFREGYSLFVDDEVTSFHIQEVIKLDQLVYDKNYHFSLDRCLNLLKNNPYTYIIVVDNKTRDTIGYINLMNIKEPTYINVRQGILVDSLIPLDDVVSLTHQTVHNLYLASILVKKEHRNKGIANKMLKVLGIKLKYLLADDYPIRIISDDVSDHGIKLSKNLGFKEICVSKNNTKIYEGSYNTNIELTTLINKLTMREINE